MNNKAALFNSQMNAQATGGAGTGAIQDLVDRVDYLENVMRALAQHPQIADAIATAEAIAKEAEERKKQEAALAAQKAQQEAKSREVELLKQRLAELQADGMMTPEQVAAVNG